jgi:hypothetical protein
MFFDWVGEAVLSKPPVPGWLEVEVAVAELRNQSQKSQPCKAWCHILLLHL